MDKKINYGFILLINCRDMLQKDIIQLDRQYLTTEDREDTLDRFKSDASGE